MGEEELPSGKIVIEGLVNKKTTAEQVEHLEV